MVDRPKLDCEIARWCWKSARNFRLLLAGGASRIFFRIALETSWLYVARDSGRGAAVGGLPGKSSETE